jgi:hypothetical protein
MTIMCSVGCGMFPAAVCHHNILPYPDTKVFWLTPVCLLPAFGNVEPCVPECSGPSRDGATKNKIIQEASRSQGPAGAPKQLKGETLRNNTNRVINTEGPTRIAARAPKSPLRDKHDTPKQKNTKTDLSHMAE